MKLLCLIFVLVSSATAQVLQLDGGDNTLLDAAGGKVTAYFPSQIVTMSGGTSYGKMLVGLSDTFTVNDSKITVGSQQFAGVTDASSLNITGVGISLQRGTLINSYGCFLGSEGIGTTYPYMTAYAPQHLGAVCFLHRQLSTRWKSGTLAGVQGGLKTAMESVSYAGNTLHFTGAGGVAFNAKYGAAQLAWSPLSTLHFGFNHSENYLSVNNQPVVITGDTASVFTSVSRFTADAVVMQTTSDGRTVIGYTSGVGAKISSVVARVDLYHSIGYTTIDYTVQEGIGRHLLLSQVYSQEKNNSSFSGGGTFRTNQFSISLQDGVVFVPFITEGSRTGFSQVKMINVSLRIPHTDASMSVGDYIGPTGKSKFSVSGTEYAKGPFDVAAAGPHKEFHAASGKYILRGTVLQKGTGEALEGVAVQIGKQVVFSNGSGVVFTRTKTKQAVGIKILPEEFAGGGRMRVIKAPATAKPDEVFEIEVEVF
jgi:hypothetical protein